MKILIAYATKTGTCEECAHILSKELSQHEVEIKNLSKELPEISNYDLSIIGGSIRMGKLDKRIDTFIVGNKDKLRKGNFAFFICNAFHEETERYFKKSFPSFLLENALIYDSFGGELKLNKQKGFDKLIVKMILKSNEENEEFVMPSILTEAIGRFADKIKAK